MMYMYLKTDEANIKDRLLMAEQLNEEENKCSRTEIDMTEEGMNHEGSKELNSVSFTFSAHRTSGLKKNVHVFQVTRKTLFL